MGNSAAAPKDFPMLLADYNLLGESNIQLTPRDLSVVAITIPLLVILTVIVKYTSFGRSMRAVAQNPVAAQLMGIDVNRVIGRTFMLGGALGGFASIVYSMYNNTIYFQMGFRVGMDAFTAAILGGIGNLTGAALGGIVIGLIRALSDQYIATKWTNTMVFGILILVLIFRPNGLLGARVREKV
jgi:branched-chain amino acid transport system permease protein